MTIFIHTKVCDSECKRRKETFIKKDKKEKDARPESQNFRREFKI